MLKGQCQEDASYKISCRLKREKLGRFSPYFPAIFSMEGRQVDGLLPRCPYRLRVVKHFADSEQGWLNF